MNCRMDPSINASGSSPLLPPSGSQSNPRGGLLPAFEPTSSPRLPRASKRRHNGSPIQPHTSLKHYPTPVPTSSTGVIPSPPSQLQQRPTRAPLHRTASTVSERVPLGDVRGIELSIDSEPLLLGRSSNSSQYQLSANRLISRVHVRAAYHGPDGQHDKGRVVIECLGWNGMRVHCQGYINDLGKGDTFTSVKPSAEIMIGVQDTRVLVRWPAIVRKDFASALLDEGVENDGPPSGRTPTATPLPSSPPFEQTHLRSPVSPSPRSNLQPAASSTFIGLPSSLPSSPPAVQVYEDQESSEQVANERLITSKEEDQPIAVSELSPASSSLSAAEDISDRDEENDPIIHSFGPFGENLLPRMASFRAVSPERRKEPLHASISPRQPQSSEARSKEKSRKSFRSAEMLPITNHIINQLAFSRLHSLPLSILLENLPVSLRGNKDDASQYLSDDDLRALLDDTPCVGEIAREGKDAAGKPLENEYYYVSEMDADAGRRMAVEEGKPGIRSVRKQHKQYFWKRPRH